MGESVSQGISKHISLSQFHFLSIRVIIYVRELCPSNVHFAPAPHNFCTLYQINHYPANKTSKFCKISEAFKILN